MQVRAVEDGAIIEQAELAVGTTLLGKVIKIILDN